MNHHQHKINLDYIIFWSSIITVLVLSHKANGILTDSNTLHCTQVQCPTKCPEDSYLKSTLDVEEDDGFEDYEDGFISHFEELSPIVEVHEEHPEHTVKERQKREVFFQEDIEQCCDNQKCVCNNCQDVPKCFDGYVAVEIHEGQGVPGNCCSLYKCIKKEECQLGVKQSWWTSKCSKCSCFGENELCTQICPEEEILQNCYSEYLQKPMLNGASWKEGPCTSCSCEQGERRCLTSFCPKLDCKHNVTYEDECCPKCLDDDDDETDERLEIVHNKEDENEEVVDEYTTETLKISESIQLNSTIALENPTTEIVDLSADITTTPLAESGETTSTTISIEKISSSPATLELETSKLFVDTAVTTESSSALSTTASTPSADVEDVTQNAGYKSSSDANSTLSHDIQEELDFTTKSLIGLSLDSSTSASTTTTEYLKPEQELQENSSSTLISSTTEVTTPTTTPVFNEETATQRSLEKSTSTETASSTSIISNLLTFTFASTETALPDNVSMDSSSTITTTTVSLETATSSSSSTESVTASMDTFTTAFTTAETIPSSQMTTAHSTSTTETPLGSTTSESSSATATTTSTTSSPFSSSITLETSSVTLNKLEETSSTSTTTAPELLQPLYQLYGDFNSDERVNISTQNQMRIMFDKIDYVVMIALFIGSLMCIALGLIIRHTKNRKKMYSSIPNSETSLSQTSTVLTV